MKNLFYFLSFFFYFSFSLFVDAQNLLRNGSFEERSQNPDYLAQVERLNVWEDRMNKVTKPCSGGKSLLHSPDFCYAPYVLGGVSSCESCIPDGRGYIGMYPYELIQQKLTNENRLRDGFVYKLSFQVRLPYIGNTQLAGQGWIGNYQKYYLAVHFAKNRMKYQSENSLDLLCKSEYMTLENTDEVVTHYIHLTKAEYLQDEWTKAEYVFNAPSSDYDWVGFELIRTPELNYDDSDCDGNDGACGLSPYTLIDDVQLIEYCDFACNADTGEPQLKVEANHIGEDAGFVQVDWTTENNSPTSPWHNKLIATWDPTEGTSSLNSNVDAPLLGIIANFQPIIFYLENANYAYLVVREWGDANVYSDFGGLYYQELPYNACGYKATPDCPLGAPLYFNGFGNNGTPIISSGGNYY